MKEKTEKTNNLKRIADSLESIANVMDALLFELMQEKEGDKDD